MSAIVDFSISSALGEKQRGPKAREAKGAESLLLMLTRFCDRPLARTTIAGGRCAGAAQAVAEVPASCPHRGYAHLDFPVFPHLRWHSGPPPLLHQVCRRVCDPDVTTSGALRQDGSYERSPGRLKILP